MPVARASSTIDANSVWPASLARHLGDLLGVRISISVSSTAGGLRIAATLRADGAVLDGILQHAGQEAMGVADSARRQPRLEQRAVPLLDVLWPKLLKLQRA